VQVAGSPTKRWLVRGRIPYGRACPTPGLRDLGDESVEDDLRARSAPGETAQLLQTAPAVELPHCRDALARADDRTDEAVLKYARQTRTLPGVRLVSVWPKKAGLVMPLCSWMCSTPARLPACEVRLWRRVCCL